MGGRCTGPTGEQTHWLRPTSGLATMSPWYRGPTHSPSTCRCITPPGSPWVRGCTLQAAIGQGGCWENRRGLRWHSEGGLTQGECELGWEPDEKGQIGTKKSQGVLAVFSLGQLRIHVRPTGAGAPVPTCASSTTTGLFPVLAPIS